MNCFVIMPFSKEFDDVYATIKTSVESVVSPQGGKCFRLDDARPAGPITIRLLQEIQSATFCVADVTGNIPNVMWEVGYAMALGKPIIIITQKISELPFDIKDMQSLDYDRNQLNSTLGERLRKMTLDTLNILKIKEPQLNSTKEQNELVGTLLSEVKELKNMLSNVARDWNSPNNKLNIDLSIFEGAWINKESNTHLYAKVINGELIVPYCYMGDDELIAVYYDWQRAGEYWFAKFKWFFGGITGFAFLRQDTIDSFSGAWWSDKDIEIIPETPPNYEGIGTRWERLPNADTPKWALDFFEKVKHMGLTKLISDI